MAGEEPDALERFAAGDFEAVGSLLEQHLPALRAYVRLRLSPALRCKESADDIVQSTCREILTHAERFQHGGDEGFRRWLYVMALRKIQHRWAHYTSRIREVGRERGIGASAAERLTIDLTPSGVVASSEEVERIEAAFDRLDESQREVIALSRVVGLSSQEVADVLGLTPGAVRTRLSRALARLAIELDGAPGQ